jgi:hypothetical protein
LLLLGLLFLPEDLFLQLLGELEVLILIDQAWNSNKAINFLFLLLLFLLVPCLVEELAQSIADHAKELLSLVCDQVLGVQQESDLGSVVLLEYLHDHN